MSNNTQALVQHLQNSSGSKSLSLRERVGALAQRAESNILLLDTSGSMSEEVNRGEEKIDILWSIVQQLRSQGIAFRVCEFNNVAEWSDGVVQPCPTGSTNLGGALQFIASVRPQQVTVVTDGEPDNPSFALEEAARLQCKINVLYVGPASNGYAQEFCRQLADAGNGSYSANELHSEQLALQAAQTARLMLTEGQPSAGAGAGKPTVINL